MLVNRAVASASEGPRSIEVKEVDAGTRVDAEGASSDFRPDTGREDQDGAEGDGKRDMLQLIHTVSTFLCSVKEK